MSFRAHDDERRGNVAARRAAPAIASASPAFLSKAIDGFPGFPGSREIARKHLARTQDVDAAVKAVIDQHVRLAGAQGFVTNLGGVVTLAISIPTNSSALPSCRSGWWPRSPTCADTRSPLRRSAPPP